MKVIRKRVYSLWFAGQPLKGNNLLRWQRNLSRSLGLYNLGCRQFQGMIFSARMLRWLWKQTEMHRKGSKGRKRMHLFFLADLLHTAARTQPNKAGLQWLSLFVCTNVRFQAKVPSQSYRDQRIIEHCPGDVQHSRSAGTAKRSVCPVEEWDLCMLIHKSIKISAENSLREIRKKLSSVYPDASVQDVLKKYLWWIVI